MTEYKLKDDPLWYKDAVIYEVHVRAFSDSDEDGLGDFRGLISRLDYLKDLGINAIWLLPFYQSPLKDDGYDISKYKDVHSTYGNLRDFREFLREAHKRGIRVIIELVLNHTSDQHNWFKKSVKARPGSSMRNFYVWSDNPNKYKDARIIFKDYESSNWSWNNSAKAYYWHRFYSHQPDLNFGNPRVQRTMLQIIDFWLKLGVDGLRLDAVPYLFEREGTNCENLPETHEFIKKLRKHVDSNYRDRMILSEANQWPSDAAAYFGKGDESHMAFHFPLMPRMFMSIQMEERHPIVDIIENTPRIPDNSQWALFLRNHDELTLEMVTDEERQYMYRVFAKDRQLRLNLGIRRRLAPLLGNDRKKIELMNILLFTMPGTPVIYYGDEIGMGDNFYLGDRNGVRTPMQWSAEINSGFSRANPQRLYLPVIVDPEYHYSTVNVENQIRNQNSLLWWMKKLIAVRKHFKAFGRGDINFLLPENSKILTYVREYEDEKALVAVNLSRYSQVAEIDLSDYSGHVPVEVFGGEDFPRITESPYHLAFAPHGYYVFSLVRQEAAETPKEREYPELRVDKNIQKVLRGAARERLESEVLPDFLKNSQWFLGKDRKIDSVTIRESLQVEPKASPSLHQILILNVNYKQGLPETYVLPLSYTHGDNAKEVIESHPEAIVARAELDPDGIIYDAVYDERFRSELLHFIARRRPFRGERGLLAGRPRKELRRFHDLSDVRSEVLHSDLNKTVIAYEDKFVLKLFRRVEEGLHPELEMTDALKSAFRNIPKIFGELAYEARRSEPITLALLQEYVKSEGNAYNLFLDEVKRYYERILTQKDTLPTVSEKSIFDYLKKGIPKELNGLVDHVFLEMVSLLGKRTGEFHTALLSIEENADFEPENFSYLNRIATSESMRTFTNQIFRLASKSSLPEDSMRELEEVMENKKLILDRFNLIKERDIDAISARIHGDYHLARVLSTGNDFTIVNLEGNPQKPITERRIKLSPLRDVASMIQSFLYASYEGLYTQASISPEDASFLEPWADILYKISSAKFLRSYIETVKNSNIVPGKEFSLLLNAFLLERSISELGHELIFHLDKAILSIRKIRNMLGIGRRQKPG